MSLQPGGWGATRHSGDAMGQSLALLLDLMVLCEHQVHLWDHLERELLWQQGTRQRGSGCWSGKD